MHGVDPGRGHHHGHQGQGESLDLLDTGTDKCPASNLGRVGERVYRSIDIRYHDQWFGVETAGDNDGLCGSASDEAHDVWHSSGVRGEGRGRAGYIAVED